MESPDTVLAEENLCTENTVTSLARYFDVPEMEARKLLEKIIRSMERTRGNRTRGLSSAHQWSLEGTDGETCILKLLQYVLEGKQVPKSSVALVISKSEYTEVDPDTDMRTSKKTLVHTPVKEQKDEHVVHSTPGKSDQGHYLPTLEEIEKGSWWEEGRT